MAPPALRLDAPDQPEPPPATDPPLTADPPNDWRAEFTAWFWLVGFNGDVTAAGRSAKVDASFGDLLDASDSIMAFSGRVEVGYGRFAGFFDGIYSDLGADDQSGPRGRADVDITLRQAIVDFGLMYRVLDCEPEGPGAENPRNLTLDLYGGARYSSLELEFDPARLDGRSGSRSWIDPMIGAKCCVPLADSWHFEVNGDIGGFGVNSQLTWSATAVFGYDFKLFGLPASVLAGYRAIDWDYSDGSGDDEFVFDMTQHGPLLGLSIRF